MKKILIVDDEAEARELVKKSLEMNEYTVITASNGEEALSISKSDKPDLILLDIVMPAIDGYQVCEGLKKDEETKDIPVLFLTGKDMQAEGIIELYNKFGARGYIPKPTTSKDILERIKQIIG